MLPARLRRVGLSRADAPGLPRCFRPHPTPTRPQALPCPSLTQLLPVGTLVPATSPGEGQGGSCWGISGAWRFSPLLGEVSLPNSDVTRHSSAAGVGLRLSHIRASLSMSLSLPRARMCPAHSWHAQCPPEHRGPAPPRSCSCCASNLPTGPPALRGASSCSSGRMDSACSLPHCPGTSLGASERHTEPSCRPREGHSSQGTELQPVNSVTLSIPLGGLFFLPSTAGCRSPRPRPAGYSLPLHSLWNPLPRPSAYPLPFPLGLHPPHQPAVLVSSVFQVPITGMESPWKKVAAQ